MYIAFPLLTVCLLMCVRLNACKLKGLQPDVNTSAANQPAWRVSLLQVKMCFF